MGGESGVVCAYLENAGAWIRALRGKPHLEIPVDIGHSIADIVEALGTIWVFAPTGYAAELCDSTSVWAIIRVWAVLPQNLNPYEGELWTGISALRALHTFRGTDCEPLVRVRFVGSFARFLLG